MRLEIRRHATENEEMLLKRRKKHVTKYFFVLYTICKDARYKNGKGDILLETYLKKANRKTKDTLGR